ncbi:unnamed protein product [Rangifer tarandus platyrhynchus]|uniref:Uncharacterized protein n=1 Tax=Rangifer tarandus platyrhynchus TaxID=3082113 RepID=A0AC59Y8H1_RANTA
MQVDLPKQGQAPGAWSGGRDTSGLPDDLSWALPPPQAPPRASSRSSSCPHLPSCAGNPGAVPRFLLSHGKAPGPEPGFPLPSDPCLAAGGPCRLLVHLSCLEAPS